MKTFVITKDHIAENDEPSAVTELPDCFVRREGMLDFRLYDDDGILYFEGFCPEQYLEDAWQWGAWYAGATRLDARLDDKFETTIG